MAGANILKNHWGSVRPYTYHSRTCQHRNQKDYNKCACAKWIYENRKGSKPRRYTLNTNSYPEAVALATDILKGFDPEEAARRKEKQSRRRNEKTILEAIQLWMDRTAAEFGSDSGIYAQYRSVFGWLDKDGEVHGNLLGFIAEYNSEHPTDPIVNIDHMTPLICQQWHDSKWFTGLASTTAKQRWGVTRSFFRFLHDCGVIEKNPVINIKASKASLNFANTPFTPEQYKAIRDQADWYVDDRVKNGEHDVYCARLGALLDLLRRTGMDLIDAVLFNPTECIKHEGVDGDLVPVLRYRRTKTGVEAVILMDVKIAERLQSIPAAPTTVPGMPFRYQGTDVRSDVHTWYRRIAKLFELAGINRVQLVSKDGRMAVDQNGNPVIKAPVPKMIRHTAAVDWLSRGVREETVAKMLGHSNTEMLREHYGPWCKQRDVAHLRELRITQRQPLAVKPEQRTQETRRVQ